MSTRSTTFGLITALALGLVSPAYAQKPLRLDIAPALIRNAPANFGTASLTRTPTRPGTDSFAAPQGSNAERDQRLARRDALATLGVGLLNGPEQTEIATTPAAGYPVLHFQKRGAIARDLRRGYRRMGENLARKVWDEPKGKRIVFDVAGKPGVGVEIPLR
jgi:hypothetical protein